jgi:hypothetical protein
LNQPSPAPSIWWFAFGYFACYAPYSALTKALSTGSLTGGAGAIDGVTLLPVSAAASMVGMFVSITLLRWWRFANHATVLGRRIPWPRWRTLASGMCTAVILTTTTLAYAFEGVSIVLAMLLMRGGLLVMAPVVDWMSGRSVKRASIVVLALSMAALVAGLSSGAAFSLSIAAGIDVALYLAAYFVRLRIMSGMAKSADAATNTSYFVEEQMVATPVVVLVVTLWAFARSGPVAEALHRGIVDVPLSAAAPMVVLLGLFSQGTGVFGGLVLLDKRENTFTIPVNRASSIMAGLVATAALWALIDAKPPGSGELVGAVLILCAIAVLSWDSLKSARRSAG